MLETHPFGIFVPKNAKYLILGSFPARRDKDNSYDWFYGRKTNQFWSIIERVYGLKLANKEAKQGLLIKLSLAMADIIHQCERREGNSLDGNLTNLVYNISAIEKLLKENPIQEIFFTSCFVEEEFKKHFKDLIKKYPHVELTTLPSPSPRYATMGKGEKVKEYSQVLPKLLQKRCFV